jgi:glutamate/tyrosine decarboxylase-like PLP-dependent enzyme
VRRRLEPVDVVAPAAAQRAVDKYVARWGFGHDRFVFEKEPFNKEPF